jgi:hypothetical protein
MSFNIGDRVKVKNHPDEVTGTVIRRVVGNSIWGVSLDYRYAVEFDDDKRFPPVMEYDEDHLELVSKVENPYSCQCGAKFTSYPSLHMQYCPKYKKP